MAVNTVTAAIARTSALAPNGGAVSVLQSVAGATGDSTFVVDFADVKTAGQPSMRGRTITLLNVGTAFGAISSLNSSLDGTNYESLKTDQAATIGANTTEAVAAVPAVTTATFTVICCGHDFRYFKIVTTGGDATSGFAIGVGG
jgi:hypothetical protein